jgi:glycine cleavage system H protein
MSSQPNKNVKPQTTVDNLHRESKISTAGARRRAALAGGEQSCVWVHAGLISYRLCDQGFDCEHCLLDAALRGRLARADDALVLDPGRGGDAVLGDRLYASGHTWIQRLGGGAARFGLDAFGAALLGRVVAVSWPSGAEVERGDPVFQIDLGPGTISLCAPCRGRRTRRNEALRREPALLIRAPYQEGWVLELVAVDPAELERLSSPQVAIDKVSSDLRRFRWCLALRLLAQLSAEEGPGIDDCPALTDLRHILVGSGYHDLVRQFVH